VRGVWNGILLRLLQRNPDEVERRARRFHIGSENGRRLVSRLGAAFLSGYNAMLREESVAAVGQQGMRVEPHFRPFFFEGAAMGYLPRGYLRSAFNARSAEKDLLGMRPEFLYLYYVGMGFWFGARHRGRPSSLMSLAPHLDPIYFPLCFDGFGFKMGFYDYPARASAVPGLARCPQEFRAFLHQGFGRALFFVHMDDAPGFARALDLVGPEHRADMVFGRSLALGFTHVDRPELLADYLRSAEGEEELAARLTGVTWALTARAMNDPAYFDACLSSAPSPTRRLLAGLPPLCREALDASGSYQEWQQRTRRAVLEAWTAAPRGI